MFKFIFCTGIGFALVWDNTQKNIKTRDQSLKTKMLLWANAYAAKNRVDSQILDNNNNSIMAKDIPISTYLPMDSDIHMLYLRMTTIVSRILVKHIPYFKDFHDDVLWHIQHCYSEEMLKKSDVVSKYTSF